MRILTKKELTDRTNFFLTDKNGVSHGGTIKKWKNNFKPKTWVKQMK